MSFTLGGAVGAEGLYLERAADAEVMTCLRSFRSCYVANPRQSGKSSLRKHAAAQLRTKGFAVVEIDLTTGGKDTLEKLWTRVERGISAELARLGRSPAPWAPDAQDDLPRRQLDAYIVEDVLPLAEDGLIILVDEVNVLGAREDADEIFAELRAVVERRTRCALCLLGVCPPADLVSDAGKDPSPLMTAVTIEDFTRAELSAFATLMQGVETRERVLDEVFAVTSGHPYMAQHLLAQVVELSKKRANPTRDTEPNKAADPGESLVAQIVVRKFFNPDAPDVVLETPQHMFGNALAARETDALNCYRRVLSGERVLLEPENRRAVQEMLRLAGLVKLDSAALVPRNQIFARRYHAGWIRDRLDTPMYTTMATRWLLEDRDPDFLLRGRSLRAADEWRKAQVDLSNHVAEFIQTSAQTEDLDRWRVSQSRSKRQILLGILTLAALTVSAIAFQSRAAEQRAAAAAAQQSLETKLAAEHAERNSVEALRDSYQRQRDDATSAREVLQNKLTDTEAKSRALADAQARAQKAYTEAKQRNASNLASVTATLDKANHDVELLVNEKARLQSDLQATQTRQATLTSDLTAAQDRAAQLDKEVAQSKALISKQDRQSADLLLQVEGLKSKTTDVGNQLSDIQAKYNDCVTRLAETHRELENSRTQVTTCETRPTP
jgi:AAA domain-containing protein